MKFFTIIVLVLYIIKSSVGDEKESLVEDKPAIDEPETSKSADPAVQNDEVSHIEPEAAVRDAILESELVRSGNEGREEFLAESPLKAIEEANVKSGDTVVDSGDRKGDVADSAVEEASEPVEERNSDVETIESEDRTTDDLKPIENVDNVNDESLRSTRDESVSEDPISERSAVAKEQTNRRMDHIVDTKARTGGEDERSGLPLPSQPVQFQPQIFKPLDFQKLPVVAQLNASLIGQPFYRPALPVKFNVPNLTPPPRDLNEFTNQLKRLTNYPAKYRFQNGYPLQQLADMQAPIDKTFNNLLMKPTDVPQANFKSIIPVTPFFVPRFATPFGLQKILLPNFNQYKINN